MMLRFHCPKCRSQMEVDESFAGRVARCPTCGIELKVPQAPDGSAPKAHARPATPTIRIDGQEIEVVPPLEILVVVSMIFVGLSAILWFILPLAVGRWVQYSWTVGFTLSALAAIMGVMIGVPAYYNVRHSRGRRSGKTPALACMAAGAVLFLTFSSIAIAGFVRVIHRPSCETNLQKIYKALGAYADKHDGALPSSLETLVQEKCLDSPDWLTCPAYAIPLGQCTYALASDVNIKNRLFPPDLMIVSDGPPYEAHPDGAVRALLLNGDVIKVAVSQWATYQKMQEDRLDEIHAKIRREKAAATPASPPRGAPSATPKENKP